MKSTVKGLNNPNVDSSNSLTIRMNESKFEIQLNEMIRLISSVLQFLNSQEGGGFIEYRTSRNKHIGACFNQF